ncbi:DMT family transporter [Nisaea acidiphila]|uniref:DMT family transporter n=1 Tax=Nisaea acidiphila TaxID=1862145 RepID=A0A9J7AS21_9PROT|nr:DMT family transporter [Nisaea acidiphila]UUX49666.1 DMT family transporter [Nisaea acidiphila]
MFELWVPITIAAAFCQNLRSALQKHLTSKLSTSGATFVRFFYAVLPAWLYVWFLHDVIGLTMPEPQPAFWIYAAIGGGAQIAATALLVYLFAFRNFAVGTTYSKTETVQAAIFGIVILGDPLTAGAMIAILISFIGVLAISAAKQGRGIKGIALSLTSKPALIGLASGACFGVSAVSYRAASLSLGGEGFLIQAGFTLACVTIMQTVAMASYMRVREPGQIGAVLRNWKVAALVGLSGMAASACWFTAMTIQNAAYVRALGQIELVFTFAASYLFFKEKSSRMELTGIALVIAGIFVLLLTT